MSKLMGFDTSRHNHNMTDANPTGDPIDFQAAWNAGYRIWIGRATVGNYYKDPWFQRDFDAAGKVGFIRLAYHVNHPEQDTPSQIDNFKEALDGREPDGIVIDAEVHGNQTPQKCQQSLEQHDSAFLSIVDYDIERVLCYTNQNFADHYLLGNSGLELIVANPGYQNGMNTNPKPSLPKWWDTFLAWQKDWKHVVPGVPDPTVDYQEWEITWEEALVRFKNGETTPPPQECNLQPLVDAINHLGNAMEAMLVGLGQVEDTVNKIWLYLQNNPPTQPPVPDLITVQVKRDPKANAQVTYRNNVAGKPIMEPLSPRIDWELGSQVQCSRYVPKDEVNGENGFYEVASHRSPTGLTLYLREQDVARL